MAETVLGGIKRASGWSIVLGILIILLGLIAMMAPLATGVVVMTILAWTTILAGIAQIVYAFQTHSGGRTFLEVILGVVYVLAGIYLISNPVEGLLTLTLLLGILLVGYGIIAVVLAFQMRPLPGWGWVMFDALVTLFIGFMIIGHWPINSAWLIGDLFGISIVFSGFTRLIVSQRVRKAASALA
jgi:uncharacterized membrane protein HdeD (DUF308 family)